MSVRKSNTLRFSKRVYATVLPLTHGAGKPSVTHCTLAAACAVSYRAELGSLCIVLYEYRLADVYEHAYDMILRLYTYTVCVLDGSPDAPLLVPWLGELEGTSLAIAQANDSPVLARSNTEV